MRPLVLDFDASVLPLDCDEQRIDLADWQEAIRFGCTKRAFGRLGGHLAGTMPSEYGVVFTGSGDYHHITLLLLREALRKKRGTRADLVVLDNHPDNMRYIFGLHCGSWVREAAALDAIGHVHVVGICSDDISVRHAWENYLTPFLRRKLTYWSLGADAGWLAKLGRAELARRFATPEELLGAFLPVLLESKDLYLSIDKDVFAKNVVNTNWDQGEFSLHHAEKIIAACAGKLCGADICGDVSQYTYASKLKRFLSRLDGQEEALDAALVSAWQEEQRHVNIKLTRLLQAAGM